jgi:hypothetical protein
MGTPVIRTFGFATERNIQESSPQESLMRSGKGDESLMTERKLLQYLRCHRGPQHVGVLASVVRSSVATVLGLSTGLRKRGLIEIRAYPSGFHLQLPENPSANEVTTVCTPIPTAA